MGTTFPWSESLTAPHKAGIQCHPLVGKLFKVYKCLIGTELNLSSRTPPRLEGEFVVSAGRKAMKGKPHGSTRYFQSLQSTHHRFASFQTLRLRPIRGRQFRTQFPVA